MNHTNIPGLVPLPDPKLGNRPGYDASARRMDQLQIVEPVKPEQLDPKRHDRFVDRVWYLLFKKLSA